MPKGFKLRILSYWRTLSSYTINTNWHLHVQSQLKKHRNKIQNMFQLQKPTEQHIKVENPSLTLHLTFGT